MASLKDVPRAHQAQRTALVHGGERVTFEELDVRSCCWAGTLVDRGVGADDLVAFTLPNGTEFLALAFGIYRAGATPAPISGKLPASERAAILDVMRPAAVVDAVDPAPTCQTATLPDHVARSWKACTSGGSTGRPKVIVDGRPAEFAGGTEFIGIPAGENVLVPGPLYHNAPFSAAVFALWRGCTVVTMDRFDAEEALAIIERERITWALMVPTMLHRIFSLPAGMRDRYDLSSWRMVVHTAAPMPAWLKRAWIEWRGPDHIWEVYGATEGIVRCWIGGREWLDRPGSVGRPIGGARLRILGEDGEEVAPGAVGEVYAMPPGGPHTSYSYIGAERRSTSEGWESVGDAGHVDQDGYLFLADRRQDLIISGGVNIWPAEVEAALLRHPAVRSCAVVGVHHEDLGQQVHALIEADDGLTLPELQRFLVEHLAKSKWPRTISVQEEPVRDDAGKFRKTRPGAAA